jgi:16S rRNA (cytidine1402-2'-O)-methyltransferase
MGTVHVVATPIGNLEDVTLRALRVLGEADLVFAEDTRRTRVLLERHGVSARPVSLHAHNEAGRIEQALTTLRAGGQVALVSDAGTPLVSDPGERLVAAAIEDGHRIESVPGASAVLAALTASGFSALPFTAIGFPPRKRGARHRLFESLAERPETLVLFEGPSRVSGTLTALAESFGVRRACVCRELTKRFEEIVRGDLRELATRFESEARGEFTLVVEGAATNSEPLSDEELDGLIRARLAEGQGAREIAAALAEQSGLPRRGVYSRVLAMKNEP